MENKKGSGLILAIVFAAMIFVAGMLIVNHLKPDITLVRGATGLDCTNTNVSDGTKATCLGVDLVIPIVIVAVVSLAGGLIVSRFLV